MRELLLSMFEIGCIQVRPKDPFTYASGLKGPIYCDNRLIPTHPKLRMMVAEGFSKIIEEKKLDYDVITGVATAGITHATLLAHIRNEPLAYARSKPKGHGQGRMVEGDVKPGQRLLLVEDLVNQGSSIAKVIEGIRERGNEVDFAMAIVDYEMEQAKKVMKNLKVELFSLINFITLADIAFKENILDREGHDLLLKWHENPQSWS
jgi:orotate phosphoribosyltransferase